MKKTKLLTSTALVVLLLTPLIVLSAFATPVSAFTLDSFSSTNVQYVLPQGTTFNGSITATGSVRFFVIAPNGTEIVDLGIIDKTTTFSFLAQQNGSYTLNFENDLPNSIQVTFSYVTNPKISGDNNSTGISSSYLLLTISIAALASLLIILILRRRSEIQTPAAHHTVPLKLLIPPNSDVLCRKRQKPKL
ncbi:MAG: hypothetical protein ABSA75_04815 [Candidatus Bathyarchaeia archaeon]|jgi:hypothetical protein